MAQTRIAKISKHEPSQVVGLPLARCVPGHRARVRRVENRVVLDPPAADLNAWFAAMDRFKDIPFMKVGRKQPPIPRSSRAFAVGN